MAFGPYSPTAIAITFALLYLGPLLAGFAGDGTASIPVFALLLLLYIAASRRPNLHETSGWVALGIMLVVQIALATALVASGMVLSSVTGQLDLPIWVPVGISAAAALFGVWRYSPTAEMDVFLDSAIERLEAMSHEGPTGWTDLHPATDRDTRMAVELALAEARSLAADATPREFDPIATRLERASGIAAFDPLYDAAGDIDGTDDPHVDLLLLRFASSDRILRDLTARGEVALAPMLLLNSEHPWVRQEARERIAQLIDEDMPCDQLPDPQWLQELDTRFPGEGFARLAEQRVALSNA